MDEHLHAYQVLFEPVLQQLVDVIVVYDSIQVKIAGFICSAVFTTGQHGTIPIVVHHVQPVAAG
jgi:hypothetical protein